MSPGAIDWAALREGLSTPARQHLLLRVHQPCDCLRKLVRQRLVTLRQRDPVECVGCLDELNADSHAMDPTPFLSLVPP